MKLFTVVGVTNNTGKRRQRNLNVRKNQTSLLDLVGAYRAKLENQQEQVRWVKVCVCTREEVTDSAGVDHFVSHFNQDLSEEAVERFRLLFPTLTFKVEPVFH